MLFGIKDRFAVEYDLEKDHSGEWLFGKVCYWIGGKEIGNYQLGTSLRDVLLQMTPIVKDSGKRSGGTLCGLSSEEIFRRLDGFLYGGSGESQSAAEHDIPDNPARFDVRIPVDVFDTCKVYLVECRNTATILYKCDADAHVSSIDLRPGEFDTVITELYHKLDSTYEAEVSAKN